MSYTYTFTLWFVFGLLFGAIGAFQLVAVVAAENPVKWINEYQALISALIAVGAAIVTVVGTIWVAEARRTERFQAYRATLSYALMEIQDFSLKVIADLEGMIENSRDNGVDVCIVSTAFELRQLPIGAIDCLKETVETSPIDLSRELVAILWRLQLYASWTKTLRIFDPGESQEAKIDFIKWRIIE